MATDIREIRNTPDKSGTEGSNHVPDQVVSDRGLRAHRLLGAGRELSPDRDAVAELIEERSERSS